MRKRSWLLLCGVIVVLLALAGTLVYAGPLYQEPENQGDAPELLDPLAVDGEADEMPYHYMVKFVCGYLPPLGPEEEPVKPGNYATAINIHNYTTGAVVIYKRPALHYHEYAPDELPPVFWAEKFWIKKRRVLEVDCMDVWLLTGTPPGSFQKGMMQISMRGELPVVAVYTAQTNLEPPAAGAAADPGAGISIDVEYIEPFLRP